MSHRRVAARVARYGLAMLLLSCGGVHQHPLDVCNCTPSAPDSEDFRHNQKHVPLPNATAQEITVATMLSWPQTPVPAPDAPRTGRELQLFHIGQAFVQRSFEVQSDCDIHLEISDVADKGADRAIAEIPSDSEYCQTRQSFQAQLAAHNFTIGTNQDLGEIDPAIPVDVTGLAFEDEPHTTRGSALVKTIWELHPAIARLTQ
jgi:hypothetical protein